MGKYLGNGACLRRAPIQGPGPRAATPGDKNSESGLVNATKKWRELRAPSNTRSTDQFTYESP